MTRPAHIVTHEGREYDLTALETPFGLLPEPVQGALKAWPHGWEYYGTPMKPQGWADVGNPSWHDPTTYRAKPAPVEDRVKCHRYQDEFGTPVERGTCIKRADGSIDWTTWEPEA